MMETGYTAGGRQSTLRPPALALLARTSLFPIVAPRGGGPRPRSLAHRQLGNAPACPLPKDGTPGLVPPASPGFPRLAPWLMTAPDNAPRAWPTANWPVSPAPMARAPSPVPPLVRPLPRSPPIPHLPRPTGPSSHPLDPLDPPLVPPAPTPTPTPARAGPLHGGPGPPVPLGRPRKGWLRAVVPAQRRRRATTPAARPRDAPTRRPAHRLSHRLSGPRRPPLVRANAPVSNDGSRGGGFRAKGGPPDLEHPSHVANWPTDAHALRHGLRRLRWSLM